MSRARRGAQSLLVAVATAASLTAASAPSNAAATTYATKHAKAVAAVQLFKLNGFADLGLPSKDAVKVRACFQDVCAQDRLRPEPACDPASAVCLGTALRAVKVNRKLVVSATYA